MAARQSLWERLVLIARAGAGPRLTMGSMTTALALVLSLGTGCAETVTIGGPDEDGDGYGADVDCDDQNADAYPGAPLNDDCALGDADFDCDGYPDLICNTFDAGPPLGDGGAVDTDGDGWPAGEDCDDTDPDVNPGQPAEGCCPDGDAIDRNCDGRIGPAADEEPIACNCFYDADGDGWGEGFGPGPDCNEMDPTINPGAEEICGDGIDQNCDGEDLACEEPPE
ncbi:MAG: hypothetical protein CMN30_15035 [Sandaracinus sp.]|nr:hypothetical protein [Sandaracinus sp.]|tara:strand:+ start:752 stop:1426 length:675 start_codon:yes stop_codon:yes gene_type:complete